MKNAYFVSINWIETHHEVVAMIESLRRNGSTTPKGIVEIQENEGTCGFYTLAKLLTDQFEKATMRQKKSLEMILVSNQAAVQRVNTGTVVAGKCGGLKSFSTVNNTITETGATLDWKLLRELLKIGFFQGGAYTHIMMNDIQKDALDDIVFSKAQTTLNATRLENTVTVIGATAYGNNVKVILNPFLADDEIIAYRPSDIFKVNLRPMHTKELGRNKDAIEKELISEMTLRVCHPYAFAWLKGLAVS